MSLEEYVGKWWNLFDLKILEDTLNKLGKEYQIKNIYPAQCNVFRAFHECNYDDCKVIMLGADPYPQKGVATGILFGNNLHNKNISPSLRIILEASRSNDQTLLSWCKQGVLMINTALSVEEGKPSSHLLLWRPFMKSFLRNMSQWNTGMIYVFFGSVALDLKSSINSSLNDILTEKHPAAYAREDEKMPSKIFDDINNLLKDKYNQTIKW